MNNGDFDAKIGDVRHTVLTAPSTSNVDMFNRSATAESKSQSAKVLFESEETDPFSSFPPEFLSKPTHFSIVRSLVHEHAARMGFVAVNH